MKPNGVLCETCGHECIDRCPACGAPQCCPACCSADGDVTAAPTWADPALPLAKRVALAMLDRNMDDATEAHRRELVADVAAADRLARAWYAVSLLADDDDESPGFLTAWAETIRERCAALDAYRSRKAQGGAS